MQSISISYVRSMHSDTYHYVLPNDDTTLCNRKVGKMYPTSIENENFRCCPKCMDMKMQLRHNLLESERGQTILGYALLAVVVAIIILGIVGLLSGNTSVLDTYNTIGELFQAIG